MQLGLAEERPLIFFSASLPDVQFRSSSLLGDNST